MRGSIRTWLRELAQKIIARGVARLLGPLEDESLLPLPLPEVEREREISRRAKLPTEPPKKDLRPQ